MNSKRQIQSIETSRASLPVSDFPRKVVGFIQRCLPSCFPGRSLSRTPNPEPRTPNLSREPLSPQEPPMPELPEVETMVRGLRPALEGSTVRAVTVHDPFLLQEVDAEQFARRVAGA